MGKSRGYIHNNQKELIRCIDCGQKYTKFMSIQFNQFKNEYKCIRCYNRSNNGQKNDIRIVLSRRYVKRMHDTQC